MLCKEKTAYEWRMSDWSSDVCASELRGARKWLRADRRMARGAARLRSGGAGGQARAAVQRRARRCARPAVGRQPDERQGPPGGDALPARSRRVADRNPAWVDDKQWRGVQPRRRPLLSRRSEEHTSELQSLMHISYAVFCLKKKKL